MSSYKVLILHCVVRASVLSLRDYIHVSVTGLKKINVFFNGESERKKWTVFGSNALFGTL